RYRPAFPAVRYALEERRFRRLPAACRLAGDRTRRHHRPWRCHHRLRGAEDRPASRGHADAHRGDRRNGCRAHQREGDHDGEARLHRAARRHRSHGARHDPAAGLIMSRINLSRPRPRDFSFIFCTWFGLWRLPYVPGTWGSLGALPFAWAMQVWGGPWLLAARSEEHTSELQSRENPACRLLL